jgi:hypothetical protein
MSNVQRYRSVISAWLRLAIRDAMRTVFGWIKKIVYVIWSLLLLTAVIWLIKKPDTPHNDSVDIKFLFFVIIFMLWQIGKDDDKKDEGKQ